MNRNSPMISKDKFLILIFGALTVLVVGLSVVGAFKTYSPVPYWDMWDATGSLEFFMRVSEGDYTAWWEQHFEHRIVLARLLFWIDLKWFGGANWFLITINYFLSSASALVFWRILRDMTETKTPTTGEVLLGLILTAWLFLWSQEENLTWAFQSQFFLAQLLPLCALYWLHKSIVKIKANYHFFMACGFGLASVGTMANGILALPLMTFYALLTRQCIVRVYILSILSVVTLYAYFHNYQAPVHHGSITQALKNNPFGLLKYILLYLGSPFYYLSGEGTIGKNRAYIAGLIFIGSSVWFAIKTLRKPRGRTLQLAILFFILYIGGTALGTAGGRLISGVSQALTSRYTTTALMAWATLVMAYCPGMLSTLRTKNTKLLLLFAALAFLIIPFQLTALHPKDEMLFDRKIAALALELSAKDLTQIGFVSYEPQYALTVAEKASAQNISIFGMYPFRDIKEQLGMYIQQPTLPTCQGRLNTIEVIDGDAVFVRISGWIVNPVDKTTPQIIRFLNSQGKMVGYALTGQRRPEFADGIDHKTYKVVYQGYLLANQVAAVLVLQGENPSCQMQEKVPVPLVFPYFNKAVSGAYDD